MALHSQHWRWIGRYQKEATTGTLGRRLLQSHPSSLIFVAVLLRPDVAESLVHDAATVKSYASRRTPIDVRLVRSPAEPFNLLQASSKGRRQADSWGGCRLVHLQHEGGRRSWSVTTGLDHSPFIIARAEVPPAVTAMPRHYLEGDLIVWRQVARTSPSSQHPGGALLVTRGRNKTRSEPTGRLIQQTWLGLDAIQQELGRSLAGTDLQSNEISVLEWFPGCLPRGD
mmetsp:Transcript_96489/g.174134  ORF Transcript_96489/g.174134 Transcript_96489/m.174134 type:complete len:227 (-) Transcript_96489:399-1079(-)